MAYRYVLLDADETLFDFSHAEKTAIGHIVSACGMRDSQAPQVFSRINQSLWKQLEKGILTAERLRIQRFEEFFAHYHLDRPAAWGAELFLSGLSEACYVLPEALGVLQELKRRGLLTAIVTNGFSRVQRRRLALSGLAPYVDAVAISEEVGEQKPSAALVDRALEMLACPCKKQALLVGDSLSSDMAAAKNAGITAVWYNPKRLPMPAGAGFLEIHALSELIAIL